MSDAHPSIVVGTPYREGSVMAIARAATRRHRLGRFYTTLHSEKLKWAASLLPQGRVRGRVENEIERRAFPGIPAGQVVAVAWPWEVAQVAARRLPHAEALVARFMYQVKESFDGSMAHELRRETNHRAAVVAMYGSAEHTFRAARRSGHLAVLNFVNSHPRYHNRYLLELAGLRERTHEHVPPAVTRRVEREVSLADLILVPSQFVARQLEALGVPADKVTVQAYGVDRSAFHPPAQEALQVRSDGRIRCLYVGQISHRKGIPLLLESARRLKTLPIDFTLVGRMVSPDALTNVPDNVRWQGESVHGGMPQAMRDADLFILPSVEDSFGLVVTEAMASGTPVIVSDHAGAAELISHCVDGLVVRAGDVTELTAAIKLLAESEILRKSIGTAARTRAERAPSWDQYGDNVLDAIDRRMRDLC